MSGPTPNGSANHGPRLVALAGPLENQVYRLDSEPFTIGRQGTNRLRLMHGSVSRHHCVLLPDGEGYLLRDLDSSCGTFVDGVPVGERRLAHGDYVKVGDSVFVYLVEEPTDPDESGTVTGLDWAKESTAELPLAGARLLGPRLAGAIDATDRTARHLAALLTISNAVSDVRGTEPLAQRIAEVALDVVPAERVAVILSEGEQLHVLHARGRFARSIDPFKFSRTLARRSLAEGLAILSHNVVEDLDIDPVKSLQAACIRSLLCIPLVAFERPVGVLWADTLERSSPFQAEHLELLTAAAVLVAPALENARHTEWLEAENERLRSGDLDHEMVGESDVMARVLELVSRVAPTDLTVLVTGASGTGKELVARAIHRNSPRSGKPFVAINCATLSETLLESELFGHEKGAFTGAVASKPGKMELAHEGTLFLDEVGEIPPALQAKLLRALEEREIERVGGTRPIRVDVRIVAATNRDLEAAIAEGGFRRDLYHRLNVFSLRLPSLAERRGDIPLLANHFAAKAGRRLERPAAGGGFSPEARACLVAYDWPGNIRELRNAVERAVVLSADGLVRPEDLPEAILESTAEKSAPGDTYHARVNEAKRRILREAVAAAGGNLVEAAKSLGLNRTYLHRLLSNLELRDELVK